MNKYPQCKDCQFQIAIQALLDIGYYASADDAHFMQCEDCDGSSFTEPDIIQ